MKIRAQFEKTFPVPAGIRWSDELDSYCIYDRALARHHSELIGYQSAWAGWHQSRATLVIRLPDTTLLQESAANGNVQAALRLEQQLRCREAIEAMGVSVLEPSDCFEL
ncbi:hypothetical protein ACYSUW_14320 [Pseudomonas frederiksbergensis]